MSTSIFKKKRINTKAHKKYEQEKKINNHISQILKKADRLQEIHKNSTKKIIFDEKINMTHDINHSVLHQKEFNDWIKRRYHKSASTDYIYKPDEIRKRLALKSIFRNFDMDKNGKLELDEFIMGFVRTYISRTAKIQLFKQGTHKFYSILDENFQKNVDEEESDPLETMSIKDAKEKKEIDLSIIFEHSDKWEEEFELEKTEKFIEGEKLEKAVNWISEKFSGFYSLVSENNYLTLKEFVKISTDETACERFRDILTELRDFLKSLDVEILRGLPTSFDMMVNFIGYLEHRNTLIERYRNLKHKDGVKAFQTLIDIHELTPSMHSIDKIQEYYSNQIMQKYKNEKNSVKKRKFEKEIQRNFGNGDLMEIARVKFGYRPSKKEVPFDQRLKEKRLNSLENQSFDGSPFSKKSKNLNSPYKVKKSFLKNNNKKINYNELHKMEVLKYSKNYSKFIRRDSVVSNSDSQNIRSSRNDSESKESQNDLKNKNLASPLSIFGKKRIEFNFIDDKDQIKDGKEDEERVEYPKISTTFLEIRKREKQILDKKKKKWDEKLTKLIKDTKKSVVDELKRKKEENMAFIENSNNTFKINENSRKSINLGQKSLLGKSKSVRGLNLKSKDSKSDLVFTKKAFNNSNTPTVLLNKSMYLKKNPFMKNIEPNLRYKRIKNQSVDLENIALYDDMKFMRKKRDKVNGKFGSFYVKHRKSGSLAPLDVKII